MAKLSCTSLLKAAAQFERLVSKAEVPQYGQSVQPGIYYVALVERGNLGLKYIGGKSKDPNVVPDFKWDPNSETGNVIFGLFEKMRFKGTATVSVVVDPNKKVTVQVVTTPTNPNLARAISAALTPNATNAMTAVPPPEQTLQVPNIITARNV